MALINIHLQAYKLLFSNYALS